MIIIDLSQIMIANVMVNLHKSEDFKIEEDMCRHMILSSIRGYKSSFENQYGSVVICADAPNNWRKEAFAHYKAVRSRDRDASKVDWDEVYRITNTVRDEIRDHLPFRFLHVDGAEADDCIATICKTFNSGFHPNLIISGDKDFQQLQRYTNVSQYNPIKKEFTVCDRPLAFLKRHIINGDKGDGIPNMLSPDDVFVTGGRQKPIRKAWVEEILRQSPADFCTEETLANYNRNRLLIDFEMIPADVTESILESFNSQTLDPAKNKAIRPYFQDKKLIQLLRQVEDFYCDGD